MSASEVKSIRDLMRLNQVQFAQLLGIHPITVSKWERGESNPTAYQATLLEHFRTAAKDQKVRDSVGGVLVGMGVGVALALLLKHLLKK